MSYATEPRSFASPPCDGFALFTVTLALLDAHRRARRARTRRGAGNRSSVRPRKDGRRAAWPASREMQVCFVGYQEPLEGQPPLPVTLQVRTAAPPFVFVIVKTVPDFDVVAIE